MSGAADDEARRQQRLVAAIFAEQADTSTLGVREAGARALRGLGAYRANGEVTAAQALAAAHPTVQAMLGDDDFAHLAREFWRAEPPRRGDLGEWGEGLAGFIDAHPQLGDWPWLGDCARLDWALHACERAADELLDVASLERLGDTDPSLLVIELLPGSALIESRWPIARIHAAHAADGAGTAAPAGGAIADSGADTDGDTDARFAAVRAAIDRGEGDAVWVARRGLRAIPRRLDAPSAAWMRDLFAGRDLGSMLERAAADFDFGAWLAGALRDGGLKGIACRGDEPA